jgi:hypothetical protein
MLKEPTHAFFECDSCGHKSGADARMAAHILPFKRKLPIDARGHCRHCGGERWTISVVYAETDLDAATSALGIAAAATIGVGSIQYSTDTSHLIYPAVPAAIVARINEDPKQRLARLGEYVRTMERSKLKDSGGRDCRTCGTLFVPARGQAWHEAWSRPRGSQLLRRPPHVPTPPREESPRLKSNARLATDSKSLVPMPA